MPGSWASGKGELKVPLESVKIVLAFSEVASQVELSVGRPEVVPPGSAHSTISMESAGLVEKPLPATVIDCLSLYDAADGESDTVPAALALPGHAARSAAATSISRPPIWIRLHIDLARLC